MPCQVILGAWRPCPQASTCKKAGVSGTHCQQKLASLPAVAQAGPLLQNACRGGASPTPCAALGPRALGRGLWEAQAEENHLEQKDCQGASVPGAGAGEHGGGELEPESGPLTHFRLSGLSGEGAWPPLSPHGPHTLRTASVGQGLSIKLPHRKWGKRAKSGI